MKPARTAFTCGVLAWLTFGHSVAASPCEELAPGWYDPGHHAIVEEPPEGSAVFLGIHCDEFIYWTDGSEWGPGVEYLISCMAGVGPCDYALCGDFICDIQACHQQYLDWDLLYFVDVDPTAAVGLLWYLHEGPCELPCWPT